MEDKVCMITTIDNPYDPIDEFDSWFDFDIENNYYTCSKLARLVKIDSQMTEKETNQAIEEAIDTLIQLDPLDLYKKVEH